MDALIEPRLEERREEDGRKAWHCLDCGFCRASKSDVSRHIEQKHIDFSIQCSICPASYTRRDKLKAHMKSKHGMFIWTFSNKKTKVTLKFVQTLTWRSFRRCAQFAVRWENWFGSVVSVIIVTSRKPTHSGMWKQSMLFANTSAPSAISQIVAEMLWSNTW